MCDSVVILRLYSCVLHDHKIKYGVNEADIRTAIQNMKEVYKPNPGSLSDTIVYVADYNDAGHRCAYLHKYAPFHTALVADMLERALQQNLKVFRNLIYPSGQINICSLGGGPGSDIFGVLSVLNATFGLFQVSATVIDCMEKWKDMFYELVSELRYGDYGALGECVGEQYFEWKYLQHNLLSKMTNQVNQAIARADLVTMIKFVSASSCKDTSAMIRKIFASMKNGALVLYIDNAGGGFHKLMTKEAENCNFESLFYQNHEHFVKFAFNVRKFGYAPCYETKISVHIWRKPLSKKTSGSLPSYSSNEENFPPLSTIAIPPSRKYENQPHNETLTFNNRVSVSSTSTESYSKFIDTDHTNLFQEISYAKNSTNTLFASNELNDKTFDNYIASDAKKVKASANSLGKSTELQRKVYPKEIPAEQSVQDGIAKNTINIDFFSDQLHRKHKTSPATVSNVKNIKTFQYTRDKSPEIRTTTNRREVVSEAYLPSRNTSAAFSWMDCIRDIFCKELIGLITGEFISFFKEDQINTNTLGLLGSLDESFLFYLFESS